MKTINTLNELYNLMNTIEVKGNENIKRYAISLTLIEQAVKELQEKTEVKTDKE